MPECMQLKCLTSWRVKNWLWKLSWAWGVSDRELMTIFFADRKENPFMPNAMNAANAFGQFTNTGKHHWKHVCKAVKCNCPGSANWARSRGQLFCNVHINMATASSKREKGGRDAGRGTRMAFKPRGCDTNNLSASAQQPLLSFGIGSDRIGSYWIGMGCHCIEALGAWGMSLRRSQSTWRLLATSADVATGALSLYAKRQLQMEFAHWLFVVFRIPYLARPGILNKVDRLSFISFCVLKIVRTILF